MTRDDPPATAGRPPGQRLRELEERVRRTEAANAALQAERDQYAQVVSELPQIVWITRPDGWHSDFNRQWLEYTGLTLDESLGHGWNPPFHPEDRDFAAARWTEATRTGAPYEIEYRLRRADGTYRWMLGRAMPLRDDSGEIVRWFGTCTDIEELKQVQGRVLSQARLLDQTQDAIVELDLDHRVLYWNRGAERLHGWSAAETLGRPLQDLICPDPAQLDAVLAVLRDAGEWRGELRFVDRAGADVKVDGRWTLLYDQDGSPRAALAIHTDVTERRRLEIELLRELEAKATHDPLTGLANRLLLFDRLELLLSQRHGAGIALAFLDLDGFKVVNDEHGHRVGDQVLRGVGERLLSAVRHGDVVARIGGDEFVVVGQAEDEPTALALGQRLAAAVRGVHVTAGVAVAVSASVGVAFVRSEDTSGADEVLSRADAVMYEAKRRAPGSAALEGHALTPE